MIQVPVQAKVMQASQGGPSGPQVSLAADATGTLETYQTGGATATGNNAFFQSLGTNGRTCATCHQPANAMSLSVGAVQQRYWASLGNDPLFAPVDGANCPSEAGPALLFRSTIPCC